MKDNVSKRINEIFADLNRKSTITALEDAEIKLFKKLDELMESLLKKFVTKEKSARSLKELERHICHCYD
jgi:phosphopantetheinyl transferase (holo-ACP synthase)